jgi:hypothetical protein
MPAITTLRTTIATALASSTWSTYSFPPATIPANSVCVIPSDPWITPTNNAQASVAPLANFRLALAVPLLDNQGNLNGIESMVVSVFNKLATSGLVYNVTAVSAPIVLSVASGDLLSCDLSISILSTWE